MQITKKIRNSLAIPSIIPVIVAISLLTLVACGEPQEQPIVQEPPAKQVEIFTVGKTAATLALTKSGQVELGKTAVIMPEIAGKITDIKVAIGDKVKQNQILVTLGNSLSTDATNISYEAALQSLDLLDTMKFKTDYSAQKDIEAVMIGYYSAKESLENAINSKDSAEELYEEQHDYLEDQLDEMEDPPDHEDNPTYEQLDSQLEQAEIGHDAQMDQIDFGIEMARKQLESAILAVEGVQAKYSMQFIQLDSTLLQAQSGADLSKLQKEAQSVRSPIDGTVTSIQAVEGNSIAPGQLLMTVSDLEDLKITTSVNENEMPLLKVGDTVEIATYNEPTYTGTISTISPTLSSLNNKIIVEIKPEKGANLLGGSLVDVVFTPNTNSIFVPLKTVTIEDTNYYVKVIEIADNGKGKTISKKSVETGRIIGELIEITSGLAKGDILATSSTTFLQEGDKVVYKVPRGK
ncbi:MAG: efflux RND transporter periplasmic adaptor subunit [Candidatus Gracilibacteria bacterium]